jgi:hypothetical protein
MESGGSPTSATTKAPDHTIFTQHPFGHCPFIYALIVQTELWPEDPFYKFLVIFEVLKAMSSKITFF